MEQSRQLQAKKREENLLHARLGTRRGSPKVIGIVPLGPRVDMPSLLRLLDSQCAPDPTIESSVPNVQTVTHNIQGHELRFTLCHVAWSVDQDVAGDADAAPRVAAPDPVQVADLGKMADVLLFVVAPQEGAAEEAKAEGSAEDATEAAEAALGVDNFGNHYMQLLKAQGIPHVMGVTQGLPAASPKARGELSRLSQRYFDTVFGDKTPVLELDSEEDASALLRALSNRSLPDLPWRRERARLLGERVAFLPNNEHNPLLATYERMVAQGELPAHALQTMFHPDRGTLQLTGFLRGNRTLSANQLVHVTGFGDFALLKIEGPSEDMRREGPESEAAADGMGEGEADGSSTESTKGRRGGERRPLREFLLSHCDDQQTSLKGLIDPDGLAGEQSIISAEELERAVAANPALATTSDLFEQLPDGRFRVRGGLGGTGFDESADVNAEGEFRHWHAQDLRLRSADDASPASATDAVTGTRGVGAGAGAGMVEEGEEEEEKDTLERDLQLGVPRRQLGRDDGADAAGDVGPVGEAWSQRGSSVRSSATGKTFSTKQLAAMQLPRTDVEIAHDSAAAKLREGILRTGRILAGEDPATLRTAPRPPASASASSSSSTTSGAFGETVQSMWDAIDVSNDLGAAGAGAAGREEDTQSMASQSSLMGAPRPGTRAELAAAKRQQRDALLRGGTRIFGEDGEEWTRDEIEPALYVSGGEDDFDGQTMASFFSARSLRTTPHPEDYVPTRVRFAELTYKEKVERLMRYGEKGENRLVTVKEKMLRDEADWPDEVDVDPRERLRERFAKYRRVKSIRHSRWDRNLNLPAEYARIFQFARFEVSLKRAREACQVRDLPEDLDTASAGGRPVRPERRGAVTLTLLNVPLAMGELLASGTVLPLVWGLLNHEHKVSVLHMQVRRTPEYALPIKAKDPMHFQVGFRRFTTRPVYSKRIMGSENSLVQRFFRHKSFITVSVYGRVMFPPANVLMFSAQVLGSYKQEFPFNPLVASGTLESCDPNRILLKRAVLTGSVEHIRGPRAVVLNMFTNAEDVHWFTPVELWTKHGLHGQITESRGLHGRFKACFDRDVRTNDTVCMSLYKRQFPPWNPALLG